jgi:uncharacterized Fe-S radical SAM superfamily protein PflX
MNLIKKGKSEEIPNHGASRASHNMTQMGHPIIAGIVTAIGVGCWIHSKFFEECTYRCAYCNNTITKNERKR